MPGLGSGLGSRWTQKLGMVSGQQVLVHGKRYGLPCRKRREAHRTQRVGSDHFGKLLVHRSTMVVVEGQVLVTGLILGLMLVIGVVHRNESSQIKLLGHCFMFDEVPEEKRKPHQVRAH